MSGVEFEMGEVEMESESLEVWVALYGEVRGVGTTKASALQSLAQRMQARELMMAAGRWES